jgi:hypothetical protein
MKRISYLKRIKLFLEFRSTLKKLKFELEDNFNARVDRSSRIYTVINIPPSLIEEPYNIRKEDIDSLAKNFIQDYTKKLSVFLNSKNLFEMYDFYEIRKVDKYSYLLVFGFSLFNSTNFLLRFYTLLSLLTISLTSVIIYLLT